MFSPYYAWSGWRAPENHCAINVALYHAGADRWAMTERGQGDLRRDTRAIAIGTSRAQWRGDALEIDIDEWTSPLPSRLRGRVVVHPRFLGGVTYALDDGARHFWRPIAPRADISVTFERPALSWRGDAYVDCNWGDEPLQNGFVSWHWSRVHTADDVHIHYDPHPRVGAPVCMSLRYAQDGICEEMAPPPPHALPRTWWGVDRVGRAAAGDLSLVRTLEDTPFYARSWLITRAGGDVMHESLSLDRLRAPIVRAMLPFRMPRIVGRRGLAL